MAEAVSSDVGAERDDEALTDDGSFEWQTRIIFRSFMFERLKIQLAKEGCLGRMRFYGLPKPVLEIFFGKNWPDEVPEIAKVLICYRERSIDLHHLGGGTSAVFDGMSHSTRCPFVVKIMR